MKKCPFCGEEQFDEFTECLVCGKSLDMPAQQTALNGSVAVDSVSATGKLMGDKNVIAGDVHMVGSQDTYHNTTNIINQDETKKVVVCHCCGRNITVDRSVDCPVCHQKTCEKCFDFSTRCCRSCVEQESSRKESQYMQLLTASMAEGRISMLKRHELEVLRVELGLTTAKAEELEKKLLANKAAAQPDTLSMFETVSLDKARKFLWNDGNAREAWKLAYELYQTHSVNEDVFSILIEAAEVLFSEEQTMKVISDSKADFLGAKLIKVRYAIKKGELSQSESLLADIEACWPDNLLVTYHRILNFLAMADKLGEDFFVQQAQFLLMQSPEPQNKLERSWQLKIRNSIAVALNEDTQEVTETYCQKEDIYLTLASSTYIGPKGKEKLEKARCASRQQIVPKLVKQYCSGPSYSIKERTLTLNCKEYYIPNISSTNKMLEEFIKNVNYGNEQGCWCKNGVKKSCAEKSCAKCILCSNAGDPAQKISAFRLFCQKAEIDCPDPDLDLAVAEKNADAVLDKLSAEKAAAEKAAAEKAAAEKAAAERAAAEKAAAEKAAAEAAAAEEAENMRVQQAIDDFVSELEDINDEKIYFLGHFNHTKLRNALDEYVNDPEILDDDVIVQIDDTVFGNAKDGCIISPKGIFVKDLNGSRQIDFDPSYVWGIKKGFFTKALTVNGNPIFAFTQPNTSSMERLAYALNKLFKIIR